MRVLFVCVGNVCASPMAEGALRKALAEHGLDDTVTVDSAGTGDWHIGDAPDPRAIAIAAEHGVDISGQRGRQINRDDFHTFDLILGMDHSNVQDITRMAAFDNEAVIDLFLGYATGDLSDVADPYYGDDAAFAAAYRDISTGVSALAGRLADGKSGASG